MTNPKLQQEFETITRLIHEARHRSFVKANTELVLLYFRVGKVVSEKVEAGVWGNKTVDELAGFIRDNIRDIKGFNRRGLYRMKQFYETYSPAGECYALWADQGQQKVRLEASTKTTETGLDKIVSSLLTQISWSHHLFILSEAKIDLR